MSQSTVIILIIVVWLIVLVPLLLRGQRPIHKSGEGFDETRVLFEGGSGSLAARRHPKIKPSDVRLRDDREDEDYELVRAEPAESEEESLLIDEPSQVVDGELVADAPGSTAASELLEIEAAGEGDVDTQEADELDGDGAPAEITVDESFVGPSDYLHAAARSDAAAESGAGSTRAELTAVDEPEDEGSAVASRAADLPEEELDEEDVEFARARSGRGGWDPERDAQRSLDRYARRRRSLLILGVIAVVALIAAVVFGGWVWVAPVVAVALVAAYLYALRTQVRQERELRARRIRHLRRARLGVRQAGAPDPRRHPGGIVLGIDDDSPDFDHLPVRETSWDDRPEHDDPRPRRSFRRAG